MGGPDANSERVLFQRCHNAIPGSAELVALARLACLNISVVDIAGFVFVDDSDATGNEWDCCRRGSALGLMDA